MITAAGTPRLALIWRIWVSGYLECHYCGTVEELTSSDSCLCQTSSSQMRTGGRLLMNLHISPLVKIPCGVVHSQWIVRSLLTMHQYFRVPADVRTSIEFQMRLVYNRRHGCMEPEIFLSVRQRRDTNSQSEGVFLVQG
jgi:hypothetical protein